VPYPFEIKSFVNATFTLRQITIGGTFPKIFYGFFKNWKMMKEMSKYWKSLEYAESLMVFVPFITTIDTCINNFISQSKPKEISQLFVNTPIKYVPMVSDNKCVICEIISNDVNNPGNSVFGPKGVICPGNLITSSLAKAMIDLMNHFDYKVEGEPKWGGEALIRRVINPKELIITM